MNNMKRERKIGAIILAAGKGKRMKMRQINKVAIHIANKPMVLHTVHMLEKIALSPIVVVIGFAKESVMKALAGTSVIFAEQKKRLGTGRAALCGLTKLPKDVADVLILNGDDSAFYTPKIIKELYQRHLFSQAAITFLTIQLDNPFGLGRVIRNEKGSVVAIVEEKDATREERKIKEINPACYIFRSDFLRNFIKRIPKSSVTGEYYLVSLIEIAFKNNKKIETLIKNSILWRGVNTREELALAEQLLHQVKSI